MVSEPSLSLVMVFKLFVVFSAPHPSRVGKWASSCMMLCCQLCLRYGSNHNTMESLNWSRLLAGLVTPWRRAHRRTDLLAVHVTPRGTHTGAVNELQPVGRIHIGEVYVLPVMVRGEWYPCPYLNPWVLCWILLLLSHWGVIKQLGGHVASSQGQPTTHMFTVSMVCFSFGSSCGSHWYMYTSR